MKISKHHIAGGLIIVAALLLAAGLLLTRSHTYNWVFVYYMSYDNDLSHHGAVILAGMTQGISDDKIAVVTQADFSDLTGMKRISIYKSGKVTKLKRTFLKSEDSADANELKKFFNYVRDNWKAENYCVVFLNHGGLLNSMCRDDSPFRKQSENYKFALSRNDSGPASGKWLSAFEAGKILADFNTSVEGKVRLLFLQQCARASIQNLYSFTDAAEFILASPFNLGAPNTYYTKTLKTVTNDPNMTGYSLARSIMNEDEHYSIYTLIDCNELKKLPQRLEPVLDAFTQKGKLNPAPNQTSASSVEPGGSGSAQTFLPVFEFEDEKFYDLKLYFQSLSSANKAIAKKEMSGFFDWCDNYLIIAKQFKDYRPDNKDYKIPDKSWRSGLSIYVPSEPNQLGRYDFLPLYKQTSLENLMRLSLQ